MVSHSKIIVIIVMIIMFMSFIMSYDSVNNNKIYYSNVITDYNVSFISNSTINYTLSFNGNLYKHIGNISFELANGTYTYSYSGNGFQSNLITFVVNGANVDNYLFFRHTIENSGYKVQFIEQGLPLDTVWSVFLNNTLYSSNTSIIIVNMPHTYFNESYNVLNVSGYSVLMLGNLTLNSNNTVLVYYINQSKTLVYYIPFIIIALIIVALLIIMVYKYL